MATYYGTYGQKVQYLSTDPSPVQTGQVWYNYTSATLKVQSATTSAAWSSGGALPAAREGMGGAGTRTATLGNGGANPGASNATLLYNGSTWTVSPGNMNTARAYCATTGTQTAAITANGNPNPAGNNYSTNSETWNGSAWTTTASPSLPSGIRAASGISTAALMSGGYSNNGSQYNQTAVESWSGSAWTSVTGLNTGRTSGQGGTGTQTAATVIGGFTYPPSGYRTDVENYNGTSWTSGTAMNTGRRYHGVSGPPSSTLAYFGSTAPLPNGTASSELWNGSTWTASATGSTGRQSVGSLGNSGLSTAALAFGGTTPTLQSLTESYLGAGAPVTRTVTVS
jgi:hypothetical protein